MLRSVGPPNNQFGGWQTFHVGACENLKYVSPLSHFLGPAYPPSPPSQSRARVGPILLKGKDMRWQVKGRGRTRQRSGEMNKTEAFYAQCLDYMKLEGSILWW